MKSLFGGVFTGKRVLVTGHTGFKGSWLSIWLNELGAEVTGYALDPYTERDNFVVTELGEKMTDIRGEIRNFDHLKAVFAEYRPEFVFHLAAQPLVRLSYERPRLTYETNVMGTVNVLEAARQCQQTGVVIIVTSDKCYQNQECIWGYREDDPLGGHDPYSSSKGCAELVTSAYQVSFFDRPEADQNGTAVASVRAGNVIGGGDWARDRLITDCITSLEQEKPIKIRSPRAIRPWQHVLEALRGYLMLAAGLYKKPRHYTGAWNFGPEEKMIITVEKVVEQLIEEWGRGEWIDVSGKDHPHETDILKLDISKTRHYLGWKPYLNFSDTIRMVVDWYKRDLISYDFDVHQIKEYLELGEEQ